MATLVIVNSFCVFTDLSQVLDVKAANIHATNMTLTWRINDTESSSAYTYKIEVAAETGFLNFSVNETRAFITPLNSSTLYNITVRPFLDGGSEGKHGFLQVYTREFTHCQSFLPACYVPGPNIRQSSVLPSRKT